MKASFLKGAAVLSFGAFVSKLLGALYRIPLTNLIGSEGIGRYQMIYPIYCLLLTVSSAGIPSALSRLVAAGQCPERAAFRLFVPLGGALTLLMLALSLPLSRVQGDESLQSGYLFLAPSVLAVSAISVLRGSFQGRRRMLPTAVSEVSEQAVKVAAGLGFAFFFRTDLTRAVNGILFSVTLGEWATLLWLYLLYRREGGAPKENVPLRRLLAFTVPVTLSAALLPLSSFLDSVVIGRLLGAYRADAVSRYGLFSGCAMTLVSLPSAVCYGISSAIVPELAGERSGGKVFLALGVTIFVSLPAALALWLFPREIASLVYRGLDGEGLAALARCVKILSLSAVLLPAMQTLSGCLTGLGKPTASALFLFLGCAAKLACQIALIPRPEYEIFGAAISANVGYLVAFLLELLYIIGRILQKRRKIT